MTWQWSARSFGDGGYGGYGGWSASWGSGQWKRRNHNTHRGAQSASFRWKCLDCGNQQTGSQCKGCNKKYWEVNWEKVTPPTKWSNPQGCEGTSAQTDPHAIVQTLLHTLKNPLPGGQAPDTHTMALAAQLQQQLLVDASLNTKQIRLRSVIDKIHHRKAEGQKLQAQADKLRSDLDQIEQKLDKVTEELTELEKDRLTLCEGLTAEEQGMEFEDEEQELAPDRAPTGRRPVQMPMGRHPIGQPPLVPDLTQLQPDQFQQLMAHFQGEAQRRGQFGIYLQNLAPAHLKELIQVATEEEQRRGGFGGMGDLNPAPPADPTP